MTGHGHKTIAVTEWAHCQRQVAFFLIKAVEISTRILRPSGATV